MAMAYCACERNEEEKQHQVMTDKQSLANTQKSVCRIEKEFCKLGLINIQKHEIDALYCSAETQHNGKSNGILRIRVYPL